MHPRAFTYGVVYNGGALKAWQASCLEQLERSGRSRLAWLRARGPAARTTGYDRFCQALRLPSQETTAPPAVAQNATLEDAPVDFILNFGSEDARDLAATAKYGVWYFTYGDLERFSSDAPGFWEIYCNNAVTGAALLKLDSDGNRVVLKSGFLATFLDSFAQNVETLFSEIASWPAQVCDEMSSAAAACNKAPSPPVHYGVPNGLQIVAMRVLEKTNAAVRYLRLHLCSIDWNIFALQAEPADFIGRDAAADVRSLCKNTKNRFLADPCVVARDSQTLVFCEEYSGKVNRGVIVAMELHGDGAAKPRVAIEEPYHLSFPQVFEHDGEFLCILETAGMQTLDLYRAAEFPYSWEKIRTLLRNVRAVDAALLRFNGKWWLFCTSGKGPRQGDFSHLYIWYADDLFATWTPHLRNPVKVDARSSRPAGQFFTHDGVLYRPTQDCSRTYGGAIRINRIDKLSETEFEETVVGQIRPPAGRYRFGIHTLSCAGGWCIVDAKRYLFNPSGVAAICKDAAKALIRRARGAYVTKPVA